MGSVRILDKDGTVVDQDDTDPADFGVVAAGDASDPLELQVENDGDEDVFFVTINGVAHPDAQVGDAEDTHQAVQFAASKDGDYQDSLDLTDKLTPGSKQTFWAKWSPPSDAPAGDVVWSIEAVASVT